VRGEHKGVARPSGAPAGSICAALREAPQKLIDRTRAPLDLKQVKTKTIFGFSHRPRHTAKRGREPTEVFKAVQAASYDLTVFKIKWDNLTLKIYDKGGRVLRIEVVVHNAKELRSEKMLEKLPALLERMRDMLVRFLGTVQAAHVSFLDEGASALPARAGRRPPRPTDPVRRCNVLSRGLPRSAHHLSCRRGRKAV
jgi:hypothetical protein